MNVLRETEQELIYPREETKKSRRQEGGGFVIEILSPTELRVLEPVGGSGVYFLWRKKRLQYVGQSTNIAKRIIDHRKAEVEFDTWTAISIPMEDLDLIEAAYINYYRPPLNKGTYRNSVYAS